MDIHTPFVERPELKKRFAVLTEFYLVKKTDFGQRFFWYHLILLEEKANVCRFTRLRFTFTEKSMSLDYRQNKLEVRELFVLHRQSKKKRFV